MDLGDLETTVKCIVVGNGGVGKSSMTSRYCKGVFTSTYKKTIGVDFLEKTIEVDEHGGETVKLMIWDTAGQEEFDALTASYYRGTGACALVFSTVDRASFEGVEKWKRKVEDECGPMTMVLVQNKVDLIDDSVVTPQEVEALARKLGLRLYRTCVKDNLNVTEVFEYLASQYILRGGAAAGSLPAVAAVGDMGADGGRRVGTAVEGSSSSSSASSASPSSAASPGSSSALVESPGAGRATGLSSVARAPNSPVTAKAAAAAKAEARAAPAVVERVIDVAGKLEGSRGEDRAGGAIKLGKDGRRERPKSNCC